MKLDWSILWGDAGLLILKGLEVTVELSLAVLLMATVIGLVFGTGRWMSLPVANLICWLYVEFARTTPPVVQILFWYFSASYVLPGPVFRSLRDFGFEFGAAAIALAIYHGAFVAETVRAGLSAVPKGQIEGARALGLGFFQVLRTVVMPQAIRIIVPPLGNEAVAIIKNTSLAMAIGVTELTFEYKYIDNFAFRGTEAVVAISVVYLLLCVVAGAFFAWLSRGLSRHTAEPAAPTMITSE